MTHPSNQLIALLAIAFLLLVVMAVRPARADSLVCPPPAKSCKIVVITPDEEATLTGPEGIFDHAVWANRAKFSDMIIAWRKKLETAPAGAVQNNSPAAK